MKDELVYKDKKKHSKEVAAKSWAGGPHSRARRQEAYSRETALAPQLVTRTAAPQQALEFWAACLPHIALHCSRHESFAHDLHRAYKRARRKLDAGALNICVRCTRPEFDTRVRIGDCSAISARTLMRRRLPNKRCEPPNVMNTFRTSERKSKESADFGWQGDAYTSRGALSQLYKSSITRPRNIGCR